MTSRHRAIVISDALLACVVGCIAAWHSPYLAFDGGVVLVGAAFAVPVFWRGRWSWAFLMRSAVTAHFFRCMAISVVGTDALRVIASRDAKVGLLAVAIAYLVRRASRKPPGKGGLTASHASIREGGAPNGGPPGDEVALQDAGGEARTQEEGGPIWSPPQFTLRAAFVLTLAWAGLLAVGVTSRPRVACFVLLLGLLWLLLAGCFRLIRP